MLLREITFYAVFFIHFKYASITVNFPKIQDASSKHNSIISEFHHITICSYQYISTIPCQEHNKNITRERKICLATMLILKQSPRGVL